MENATIVQLAPAQARGNTATFEEAFGSHSELRGKGQARRATKKAARVERKVAKQRGKAEVKAAKNERKQAAQQGRKERRSNRTGLLGMYETAILGGDQSRAEAQEAREGRRDTRVTRRLDRKSLRKESRGSEPEPEVVEEETIESQAPEINAEEQEQGYAEEGGNEEAYAEEGSNDGEMSTDEWLAENSGADGNPQDFDFEGADGSTVKNINPEIKSITKKIVWNREAKKRLGSKRAEINARYMKMGSTPDGKRYLSSMKNEMDSLSAKMAEHDERISDLNGSLKKFGNNPQIAEGFKMAEAENQKAKEVKDGKLISKKTRETIVPGGLHAEIEPNRINVPSSAGEKIVEMSSGADGSGSGSTVIVNTGMSTATKLIVGVAIAYAAYYFAKKYKYIK